jgi:hypothetical protein
VVAESFSTAAAAFWIEPGSNTDDEFFPIYLVLDQPVFAAAGIWRCTPEWGASLFNGNDGSLNLELSV